MMAAVPHQPPTLSNSAPSFWSRFNSEQQQSMIDEDLNAGITVSMVLFGVLTFGLLGMILSVLLTL